MTSAEFKTYISHRLLSESGDDIAIDFGVTRQAVYRWRDGETPSKMALIVASNIGLNSGSGEEADAPDSWREIKATGASSQSRVSRPASLTKTTHHSGTCRGYNCGMCLALKEK